MSGTQVVHGDERRALNSAPIWLLVLVLAGTATLTQGAFVRWQGGALVPPGLAHAVSPQAVAWLAAGAQLLGNLVEASVYALFWRRRGVAIPIFRYWVVLALLANLDGIASALAAGAAAPAWLGAPLAGVRVLAPGPPANGLMAAFGGVGLLALTRVALTAEAQAHLGAPRRRAWLVVGACWLAFRLLAWWSFDLARGMSSPR